MLDVIQLLHAVYVASKYFLLQYFPKVKVFDLAKAELRNNCQKILLLLLF